MFLNWHPFDVCWKFVQAMLHRIAQCICENRGNAEIKYYWRLNMITFWRCTCTQNTVWWRVAFQNNMLRSEVVLLHVLVFLGRESRWKTALAFGIHITRVFFTPSSLSWWNCRPRSIESFDWKVHSFKTVGMYKD